MTNEELKKKIMLVLYENIEYELHYFPDDNYTEVEFDYNKLADALIAAGIGDLKEHRIFAGKDGSIKQLYSGEEVEKIVKEREEYKHRAEVAENELKLYKLAVKIWQERYSDIRCFNFNIALNQAEKELAEERKDE